MSILSVIVPATNRPETLARCRAAIESAPDAPDEVIVVDGPSELGAAAARNLGAERASGDVLVFIDADVVVHPDTFTRARAAFDRDGRLTALFGSYDDCPAAPGAVSGFRNLLHHNVHQHSPGPARTFWTGLGAVRADAFAALGGFDPRTECVEDVDFGMRLAATGARIELDPELQCTHLKAWSLPGMVRTDLLGRGVPWTKLLLRHHALMTELNLGWRHRLSALASLLGVAALLAGEPVLALWSLAALVALNKEFYGLLVRREGVLRALLGVGLHVVHHLTAIIAVPLGVTAYLAERRPQRAQPPAYGYANGNGHVNGNGHRNGNGARRNGNGRLAVPALAMLANGNGHHAVRVLAAPRRPADR
ncbi:MAG TPA: glycosyltransferase, partial [Solirubrobacteraceae bacterium]